MTPAEQSTGPYTNLNERMKKQSSLKFGFFQNPRSCEINQVVSSKPGYKILNTMRKTPDTLVTAVLCGFLS